VFLAKKEVSAAKQAQAADIERTKRRLDILDHRLDNIDSVVSAVAERVMKQPVLLNITCPHCRKNIEIAILGIEKPTT
jgi:ribosomal protein L44E